MKKEELERLANEIEDAEMMDLGAPSELTEGSPGVPGELNFSIRPPEGH